MSREAMEPPPRAREESGTLHPAVASLQERIGLAIADPEVGLAALTHKSYVNEHRGEEMCDNERLEFLGDAVIDLAVSHRLMEQFPQAREGELSKIRAAVVDEAGLARIARELDLGTLLRLGRGEELTGGRQKSSLLADAMEAVVAALYLGGGLGPVLTLIDRFLGEAFERAAAGTLDRDYKTQLQELAQSRLRATPRYRVVAEHGPDHSKVFDVELELRGEVLGRGEGRSKKDAEQAAAKLALDAVNGRLAREQAPQAEGQVAPPPGPDRPSQVEPLPPAFLEPPPPAAPAEPAEAAPAPPPAAEPIQEDRGPPPPAKRADPDAARHRPAKRGGARARAEPAQRRAPRAKPAAKPAPKPAPKPRARAIPAGAKARARGAESRPVRKRAPAKRKK